MANLQDTGKGLNGKFVKTFTPGSSEHLAIQKLDAIILALKGILAKLDADTGVADTNYSALWAISQTASDQLIQSPKTSSSI